MTQTEQSKKLTLRFDVLEWNGNLPSKISMECLHDGVSKGTITLIVNQNADPEQNMHHLNIFHPPGGLPSTLHLGLEDGNVLVPNQEIIDMKALCHQCVEITAVRPLLVTEKYFESLFSGYDEEHDKIFFHQYTKVAYQHVTGQGSNNSGVHAPDEWPGTLELTFEPDPAASSGNSSVERKCKFTVSFGMKVQTCDPNTGLNQPIIHKFKWDPQMIVKTPNQPPPTFECD